MSDLKFGKSSIGKKVLMALSGFFLLFFLAQHAFINLTSLIGTNGAVFNEISHFMGTNPLIQYLLQPILIFGFMFHLIMGILLEIKNNQARNVKYVVNKGSANSTWMSRNMIFTGIMIFLFLGLHFYDFWIPEIKTKFIEGDMSGKISGHEGYRYYYELNEKFHNIWRVILYCMAFIFLSLHLMHGFVSAFQSVGFRHNKYIPIIKAIGKAYAVLIPLIFIVVALYHFLISSN